MNKQDLRVLKTKNSLQQALLELLKTIPLEKIKVTEICKAANINRGTFYLHYGTVEDVFHDFFQEVIHDLQSSYDEPYKNTIPFEISKINPNSIQIFHHIKRHQSFYEIVFSKNTNKSYYYMLFDQIRLNMERDYQSDQIPDVPMDYIIGYQANAIIGLIIVWYEHGFKETPEEMSKKLHHILKISR
ncbi:TetR/AcrR family transcriptional regulator [Sporosarcina koreensis]|uniref:TetR/AcrR family transcriptional regulator n=1 Tax=Sporosarcina koreensis TaxID=334735 RepID=UPI000757298E|nr:TetR/AcrR family transcriptional regulator [Sporosarcina koreensis]